MANTTFLTLGALATAVVGYCAWFDYRRRNDPDFRRALRQQSKAAERKARASANKAKKQTLELLKSKLVESLLVDPLPTAAAEREQYFMQQVGAAEKLAATSSDVDTQIQAAIHFYKALAIYPNPTAILEIYQKSVPAEVYELIMALAAILPPASISSILEQPQQPVDETD